MSKPNETTKQIKPVDVEMYIPNITREYNVDAADSLEAFADAVPAVYEKFGVGCPLHVYENGFEQGDASDAEIDALMKSMHIADRETLFDALNGELSMQYRRLLEAVNA